MKKIFTLMLFGIATFANAQTFDKGTSVIQAGLGIGSDLGTPIGLAYEYGFTDKIGVGAYVGYASKIESLAFFGDVKYSYTLVGARGNYHFYQTDKIDAYGGILLGYNSASLKVSNSSNSPFFVAPVAASAAVFGGHVGAKYYFTESIAAFGEVGYGLGFLNLGLAMKF